MENINKEDLGFLQLGDSEIQLPEPKGLSDSAKKRYYQIGNAMIKANILLDVDYEALKLLSLELEHYEILQKTLDETLERHGAELMENNGFVFRTVSTQGEETFKKHPLGEALRDKTKTIRELMAELGLTPQSRNRMNVEKTDKLLDVFKKAMEV